MLIPKLNMNIEVVNASRFNQVMIDKGLSDDSLINLAKSLGIVHRFDLGDVENARCGRGMTIQTLSNLSSVIRIDYKELIQEQPFNSLPMEEDEIQLTVFQSHKEGKYKETLGLGYLRLCLLNPFKKITQEEIEFALHACCDVLLGARPINDSYSAKQIVLNNLLPLLEIAREQNYSLNENLLRRICIEFGATMRDSSHYAQSEKALNFAIQKLGEPKTSDLPDNQRGFARNCEHLMMLHSGTGKIDEASTSLDMLCEFTGEKAYGVSDIWIPRMLIAKWMKNSTGHRQIYPNIDEMRDITKNVLENPPNVWSNNEAEINTIGLDEIEGKSIPLERIQEIERALRNVGPQGLTVLPTLAGLPKILTKYFRQDTKSGEQSLLREPKNIAELSGASDKILTAMHGILSGGKNRTSNFDMGSKVLISELRITPTDRIDFSEKNVSFKYQDGKTYEEKRNCEWDLLAYILDRDKRIHYLEGYLAIRTWITRGTTSPYNTFTDRIGYCKEKIEKNNIPIQIEHFKGNTPYWNIQIDDHLKSNIFDAKHETDLGLKKFLDDDFPEAKIHAEAALKSYSTSVGANILYVKCLEAMLFENPSPSDISQLDESYILLHQCVRDFKDAARLISHLNENEDYNSLDILEDHAFHFHELNSSLEAITNWKRRKLSRKNDDKLIIFEITQLFKIIRNSDDLKELTDARNKLVNNQHFKKDIAQSQKEEIQSGFSYLIYSDVRTRSINRRLDNIIIFGDKISSLGEYKNYLYKVLKNFYEEDVIHIKLKKEERYEDDSHNTERYM